jgi:CBS domain-containing protein
MDMKVRDVMTPDPVGVHYDQAISDAARVMRDAEIGALVVVNGQLLSGVVTDRDLIIRAVAQGVGPGDPVGPLCSSRLVGVDVEDDVSVAERLMRENAVRRLPVIEADQVAGMVSIGDLAIATDADSPLAQVSKAPANT